MVILVTRRALRRGVPAQRIRISVAIGASDVAVDAMVEWQGPGLDRARAEIEAASEGQRWDRSRPVVTHFAGRVRRAVVVTGGAALGFRERESAVGAAGVVAGRTVQAFMGRVTECGIRRREDDGRRAPCRVRSRCPLATEPRSGPGGQQEAGGQEDSGKASWPGKGRPQDPGKRGLRSRVGDAETPYSSSTASMLEMRSCSVRNGL